MDCYFYKPIVVSGEKHLCVLHNECTGKCAQYRHKSHPLDGGDVGKILEAEFGWRNIKYELDGIITVCCKKSDFIKSYTFCERFSIVGSTIIGYDSKIYVEAK